MKEKQIARTFLASIQNEVSRIIRETDAGVSGMDAETSYKVFQVLNPTIDDLCTLSLLIKERITQIEADIKRVWKV